jgi:hypothetical protein
MTIFLTIFLYNVTNKSRSLFMGAGIFVCLIFIIMNESFLERLLAAG